ncbi:unnamed protein product [Parnassius mnemosyne]|uniref:Acyltransferase 3 domain-containing protein n=1 Tax=Parnassius mnemosyne TaxID=213953 RepID=A0AAV1M2H1_9NEOP
MDEDVIFKLKDYDYKRYGLKALFGADLNEIRSGPGNPLQFSVFRLAVCIPKPCTTQEAISELLFNISSIGFQYEDDFCRLPNDKPWVPADYTAIGLFFFIGFLCIMSTCYEINHIFILKSDPKSANALYRSFSVYSNTSRLLNFSTRPGALECLDGIRALAMIWILIGHSFSSQSFTYNPLESLRWMISLEALWVTAGHIAVDTFFMLSGLLVVYTTAGKLTSVGLLKNIHFFYLNRLLRMFPVLATTALLEASLFNHVSDGPVWDTVISQAHRCRTFWWSTLLHIQNYVNSRNICIGATWYLAIDTQLHILSPIILVWVLSGNKGIAWIALTAGVVTSITAATIYNFINEFPTGMISAMQGPKILDYIVYYYMNTLTRAPPFFVGMMFGYLLHIWRGKRLEIATALNLILWALSLSLLALAMYCIHPTMQIDWNNQTVDSLINSFMRPAWALGLGWVIFACVHGYGGPINWFLSLRLWKLPARLSYAMYILHFSLMVIVNSSSIAPIYFSVPYIMFLFCAYFALSMIIALIITIFIDMPFSTLFKMLLDKGR